MQWSSDDTTYLWRTWSPGNLHVGVRAANNNTDDFLLKARGKLLKAVCSGKRPAHPVAYDLATSEGSVAVTFALGGTLGYCADFGPTSVVRDDARTFKAAKAPALLTCPGAP